MGVAAYYKEKTSAELVHESSKHLWRILGASDLWYHFMFNRKNNQEIFNCLTKSSA